MQMAKKTPAGYKELEKAVKEGNVEHVDFLLNVKTVDPGTAADDSLLSIACANNNLDIVRLLVTNKEHAVDPNVANTDGLTPLAAVLHNKPTNMELLRLLVNESVVKVNRLDSLFLATSLISAVKENNVPLVEILLKAGADPNRETEHKTCPLAMAIYYDNVDMCKVLLEYGCSANTIVQFDEIALGTVKHEAVCMAASWGNMEIVQLLVDNGANITLCFNAMMDNIIKGDRAQILEYTLQYVYSQLYDYEHDGTRFPIILAIMKKAEMCVRVLLRWGFFTWKSSSTNSLSLSAFRYAAQKADAQKILMMMIELNPHCLQDHWLQIVNCSTFKALYSELLALESFTAELNESCKQPPRLDILCRTTIVEALGFNPFPKVQKLQLPNSLKDFLQFKNVDGF